MTDGGVDEMAWASDLCTLLDRIEMVADDSDAVKKLCRFRFEIAEKHGMTVEFFGPQTSRDQ